MRLSCEHYSLGLEFIKHIYRMRNVVTYWCMGSNPINQFLHFFPRDVSRTYIKKNTYF